MIPWLKSRFELCDSKIMGENCSTPGWRPYYGIKKEYCNVFKFSADLEGKELWMCKLHPADFSPKTFSVECIKHFDDRFIICENGVKRLDGTGLVIRRKKKIWRDACPTFHENISLYLSRKLP